MWAALQQSRRAQRWKKYRQEHLQRETKAWPESWENNSARMGIDKLRIIFPQGIGWVQAVLVEEMGVWGQQGRGHDERGTGSGSLNLFV